MAAAASSAFAGAGGAAVRVGQEVKTLAGFRRRWHLPAAQAAAGCRAVASNGNRHDRYLVDLASSHMLVSKIKPCMSKYKPLYGETANGSLYQL